ncbi:MAG: hypothetical protein HRU14_13825 [Planctomycetes bacterium]|nr:hypothetical protein [Planctomycetota bacterium]
MSKPNKNESGLTGGYRFGVAVNVVVICLLGTALAIGLVAAVRQLSYRVDLRFDTTHDKRYALDPLAKQLLREIESPLEVYYCWGFDEDLKARVRGATGLVRGDILVHAYQPILQDAQVRIRRVLQEWAKATPHLELTVAFQERQAMAVEGVARKLGVEPSELLNRVILRHGGRHLEIPLRRMMVDMQWGMLSGGQIQVQPQAPRSWRVREELVAALRSITAGETIAVGVLRGFRGRMEPGTDEYAVVSRMLKGEGYEPTPFDLSAKVPDRLQAVIVGAPRANLDLQAARNLEAFERRGGRILICASAGAPETFRGVLEPYGISLPSMLIADDGKNRPAHRAPGFLESSEMCVGEHKIIREIKKRVRVFMGICRPLMVDRGVAPRTTTSRLMEVSPFAQADVVRFEIGTGKPEVVPGRRQSLGSACIAAACERDLDAGKKSRVVVIGTEDVFQEQALLGGSLYGNRDLLLNSIAWLTDRESAIGLVPRTEQQDRWINTRKLETPFTVVAVLIMPLLAAVTGMVVFYVRRN